MPIVLTKARAAAAWEARSPYQGSPMDHLTTEERSAVDAQWARMGGDTSWMTAFFRFLNGTADADLLGVPPSPTTPAPSASRWGRMVTRWHDEGLLLHLLNPDSSPACGSSYYASAGPVADVTGPRCRRCEAIEAKRWPK